MKKLYPLCLSLILLPAFLAVSSAQEVPPVQEVSPAAPVLNTEKILLFDAHIRVHPDGTLTVTENITVNALHQKIRRGIYRDIPLSLPQKVVPLSLHLDGQPHPFFTEKKSGLLRINFGNDALIARGVHTYKLVYTFTHGIGFHTNHDELYWNVTGNGWDLRIDTARAQVVLPKGARLQPEGISLYTGASKSKASYARQTGNLSFETIRPLFPREGLTIAIPFDKGAITPPAFEERLAGLASPGTLSSLVLLLVLLGYYLVTWCRVGKDPAYFRIPQYEPPQETSPALMYYLHQRQTDSQLFACALLSLAMKGHLEIQPEPGVFSSKTKLILQKKERTGLPPEEGLILAQLFPPGVQEFVLQASSGAKVNKVYEEVKEYIKTESKKYILSNAKYLTKAIILLLLLGSVPFILLKTPQVIFINLHYAVFFTVFTLPFSRMWSKTLAMLVITAFYTPFWLGFGQENPETWLSLAAFVTGMWGMSYYSVLIQNVTPLGRETLSQIYGFERYMKTAEPNRVAASNPLEAERIFCAFLPFAFALSMSNAWMTKFEKAISKATVEKYASRAGGPRFVTSGLAKSVSASMPSRGGGSRGGGFSGGGRGGGGRGGGGGGGR